MEKKKDYSLSDGITDYAEWIKTLQQANILDGPEFLVPKIETACPPDLPELMSSGAKKTLTLLKYKNRLMLCHHGDTALN